MLELRAFGGLDLRGPSTEGLTALRRQPKRLALLVYLAIASPRGFHRRDTLLTLLWPELDSEHARASLRTALAVLRSGLGDDTLVSRGTEEVGIESAALPSDVEQFEQALETGRLADALELYRGDLLQGFHVSDAPDFERWLDEERERHRQRASQAGWALAQQAQDRGNEDLAAEWGRRAAALTPYNEPALRRLLTLLERAGDRIGAVRAFEEFARRLREELEVEPSSETVALVAGLKAKTGDAKANTTPAVPVRVRVPIRRSRETNYRRAIKWIVGGGVLIAAIVFVAMRGPSNDPRTTGRKRVAVAIFENRTNDHRYDQLGFMAADWVTEGLQRTGQVDVVPTLIALTAQQFLRTEARAVEPAQALARETAANLIVKGSIYQDRDSLVFQAQLVNADSGRLVGVLQPIRSHGREPVAALNEIRIRLMGLLALSLDDRVLATQQPPTYVAYQAFSDGMDGYIRRDYPKALAAFKKAHQNDTSFAAPLLYASFCYSNVGNFASADSLLHRLVPQRSRLTAYDQYWLDYRINELSGDESSALAAIRQAAELAPASKATYNFAVQAFEMRAPVVADSALQTLSPDVGAMRGWLPYWDVLAMSLHVQGKYRRELKVATEAPKRFPDKIRAQFSRARALAALHKLDDLAQLWNLAATLQDATPIELGNLAYDIGSELWTHGDSITARWWFTRAYEAFGADLKRDNTIDGRWGRARAASRLGKRTEALAIAGDLTRGDSASLEYTALVGILSAQIGKRAPAEAIRTRLARNKAPYTWGRPQYQAALVAAALGDDRGAMRLLALANVRSYPYSIDVHREPVLIELRRRDVGRWLEPYFN